MRISKAEQRRTLETEPLLMSKPESALALGGLHLSTIGKLVRAGKLERVFVGRRSMVTVKSVRALAAGTAPTTPTRFYRRGETAARSAGDGSLTESGLLAAGSSNPSDNP
jgi:hypothetical protein